MVISYIGIAMRSCLQMPDDVAMLPGDAVAEVFHVLRDHTGSAGGREKVSSMILRSSTLMRSVNRRDLSC